MNYDEGKQQQRHHGQQRKRRRHWCGTNGHFSRRFCRIFPTTIGKTSSFLLLTTMLIICTTVVISHLPAFTLAMQFPSSGFSNVANNKQHTIAIRAVSTPFGIVRGQLVSPLGVPIADAPLPPVVQYLSIPYGSAPTGQHRFKMPISAPKWMHQPKDAFRLAPSCIQSGLSALSTSEALKVTTSQRFDRLHRILPMIRPQSEDCLFMNLFVPERRELHDAQPLSVLVLVHGDTDYSWGGANAYNGTLLASLGRVVVVTLNYRLGVYGFLGRCDPETMHSCVGNAGLSDLVAALKMLSLLLPSFGADPNAVTLLGWESGAALVSLLMASPITQPKGRLFRRAILLDGTALAPWAMGNNPQEQFMRLAEELKCLGDFGVGGSNSNSAFVDLSTKEAAARILYCFQNHSTLNLSAAARQVANASPTFLSAFSPIIDGQMVPNHPKILFSPKFGALFREIDLLIGTVVHPAQHLLSDQDMQHGLGTDRRDKILRTLVRNIFDFHRTEILQAILNEYTDWDNPKNHPKSTRNGLMAALSDFLFTAPLVETARAHSLDDIPLKSANTFFFVFAHETSGWMREQPNSGLRGSFTGDHLPYILGHPFSADVDERMNGGGEGNGGRMQFSPEDKQLCRVMITYVANFVKSGDPSRPQQMFGQSNIEERFQGLPWPQFSPQTREAYLEITDRPRVKNYYRNSFVQFWNGFVPVLNRRGGKDVPEEHHLLPDHFDRSTFFGQPSPFSTYHNIPFPPPPMPPTPFPKELRKQLIFALTTKRPAGASGEFILATATSLTSNLQQQQQNTDAGGILQHTAEYSFKSILLVIIGIILTAFNLCILTIISRKCVRKRSESQKKFQYQSYATPTSHMPPPPGLDMNFPTLLGGGQQTGISTARRHSSQYSLQAQQALRLNGNNNNNSTAMNNHFHHHYLHRHAEMQRHSMVDGTTAQSSHKQLIQHQQQQQQPIELLDTDSSLITGTVGGAQQLQMDQQRRHSFTTPKQTNSIPTTEITEAVSNDDTTIATRLQSSSAATKNLMTTGLGYSTFHVGIANHTHTTAEDGQQNVDGNREEKNSKYAATNNTTMVEASLPKRNNFRNSSSTIQKQQRNGKSETAYLNRLNRLQLLSSSGINNNNIGIGAFELEQHPTTTDMQQQQQRRRHTIISKPVLLPTKQHHHQQQQQEPLLSATGSLKGSTPSVVIQQPSAGGPSLIRLSTGISPTCPRHGRAAQMMLAAAAASRASNFGNNASGGTRAMHSQGVGMMAPGNGGATSSGPEIAETITTTATTTVSMGGQQPIREQQHPTLEEVQV